MVLLKNRMHFFFILAAAAYVLLIIALVSANFVLADWSQFFYAFTQDGNLLAAVKLSLLSSIFSASLGLIFAIPIAYLLSRKSMPFSAAVETVLDIPLVLPPVVLGLSLLLFFKLLDQSQVGALVWLKQNVVFEIPAILIAQIILVVAFTVRTMKIAFDQMPVRQEQVAMTLGCSRWGAFTKILLPQSKSALVASWTLGFARSIGEFGPIMIFAGATEGHTQVMSTAIYNQLQAGELNLAIALSIMMIAISIIILVTVRFFGFKSL